MFDDYSATLPLIIVVMFETFSVSWLYGADRWRFFSHSGCLMRFQLRLHLECLRMFPGFLTTSMPCWAGVPTSFINTCGSTSACWLCWGCLELPPSACLFIPRPTGYGTRKRYETFYFCRKIYFYCCSLKTLTSSDGSTKKKKQQVELQLKILFSPFLFLHMCTKTTFSPLLPLNIKHQCNKWSLFWSLTNLFDLYFSGDALPRLGPGCFVFTHRICHVARPSGADPRCCAGKEKAKVQGHRDWSLQNRKHWWNSTGRHVRAGAHKRLRYVSFLNTGFSLCWNLTWNMQQNKIKWSVLKDI